MKLINLLIKIAMGEKPPKKIKIFDIIFEYVNNFGYKTHRTKNDVWLFNYIGINDIDLNFDVEIIEE